MKYRRQKLITFSGWAALLLVSLACGIPSSRPPRPFPIPGGPDDDAGTPLSHPDRQFPIQPSAVNSVAFDPTGRRMATAGQDKAITVWNFQEMRVALQLRGHSAAVTSVAFAPDGKTIASASRDKSIKLWNAATGQLSQTLTGHTDEVRGIAFSPEGQIFASTSSDSTVKLWDAQTGRELRTLRGHTAAVNAVAFSPDGKTLVSASDDKSVRLWDVQTGGLFQLLTAHTEPVLAVEFSPDGQTLASGSVSLEPLSHRGSLKFWNAITGRETFLPSFPSAISGIAFRPDGRALAVAYLGDGGLWNIDVLDLRDGHLLRRFIAHRHKISQLAYSPDGFWLVSVGADKAIRCWH